MQFFLLRLAIILFFAFFQTTWAGNFYAGTSPANVPWPGGIVPFEFDTNILTTAQQQTYLDGLHEWELAANVTFVPHTSETRWIFFTYNTNFIDNVSPGYSPQTVTVSSLSRAQVCHEMGHSFGFNHENIRPDAANFITVLTNNITPGNLQFFQVDPTTVTNGPYDFESVMHLGWDFASTQPGVLPTQQPKPPYFPRYQFRMGNLCLSPGDRAALKFLYGPPVVPLTNLVTTTTDSGPGSLRAALYYATDNPGAVVRFNIPVSDPGYSNGVFNIHLTGHLPPLAQNGMVIDGSTQPGFTGSPLIFVDGSQIIPETFTSNSGLLIYSSSNQVKNISFSGFNWNGLTLEFADATNNTIAGCWLGLDSTGSNAAPNAFQGILFVNGAGHNLIGGTNALARNVISGNAQYGIWMSDSNTTGNTVLGNYIGTDAGGSFAVPNPGGGIGMFSNSVGHVIGDTNALARNVISGNVGAGIWLAGPGVSNNLVQGNFIGTDAGGTTAVPNNFAGIRIESGATGNFITGNVISGNTSEGLRLIGPGTAANMVQGNFIGTDASGTSAVPNGDLGIDIFSGASSNLIGGTTSAARNVLSGNPEQIRLSDAGTRANVVQGNFIGTDVTGLSAFTNGSFGLTVYAGASGNLIGGTVSGARNVISGNNAEGLRLSDTGTTANTVQGNFIGTDVTGTNAIPNGFAGLTIFSGATSNLIGGTSAGARNIISGNYFNYGLVVANAGTSENLIQGNYLGLAPDGTTPVPNFHGLLISDGATGNTFGGTTAAARNVISGNNGSGIFLTDPGTSGNFIQGNFIGTDATGANAAANGYEGIYIVSGAGGNFIGGTAAGAGNVISGNTQRGIYAYGTNTSGNLIEGNFIGTKINGTNALGNHWDGVVFFDGASSNIVGLASDGSGTGNIIAFNGFTGVYVGSDNSDVSVANTIRSNAIFANGGIGINLAGGVEDSFGVTANDPGDADTGPNNLQNYPVITNAFGNAIGTIVQGNLNSMVGRTFSIDVYRNLLPNPSGYGQGQFYIGSMTVITDDSGNATFALTNNTGNFAGQYFTATATSAGGDTSEFSADVLAGNVLSPSAQFGPIPVSQTNGFIFNLTLQTNFSYRIQATTNLSTNPIPWVDLTNFTAGSSSLLFTDRTATNFRLRFYRVVSP